MTAGVKRFRDGGQIAILGAGSMGRLWAALLPSSRCGFLPRLDRGRQIIESANTVPKNELDHRGSISRPELLVPLLACRGFIRLQILVYYW